MNIGLIILVTTLFLNAEDNNTVHPDEINNPNSEPITTNENPTKATLYYEIKQNNKFRLHACDATKTLDDGEKQNISYSYSDLTCVFEDEDGNLLVNLLFNKNNDGSPSDYYFFKGKSIDLTHFLDQPN